MKPFWATWSHFQSCTTSHLTKSTNKGELVKCCYIPNVPSPVTTVTYFFLFLWALERATFLVTFFVDKIRKQPSRYRKRILQCIWDNVQRIVHHYYYLSNQVQLYISVAGVSLEVGNWWKPLPPSSEFTAHCDLFSLKWLKNSIRLPSTLIWYDMICTYPMSSVCALFSYNAHRLWQECECMQIFGHIIKENKKNQ